MERLRPLRIENEARHQKVWVPETMRIHRFSQIIAACLLLTCSGCMVLRGVDFGHWARYGEQIEMIRVFNAGSAGRFTGNDKILLLPPTGKMPGKNLDDFQKNLRQELQNSLRAMIVTVSRDGRLAEYVHESNLIVEGDMLNLREVGRIGRALGVSHVVCVHVREFRPYTPQVLALYLALVESESCNAVVEMSAVFDASEQEVVLALGEYLQARRARKYDIQNLDVMLRSPSEYGAFVSAQCSKALADALGRKTSLKTTGDNADTKKGG